MKAIDVLRDQSQWLRDEAEVWGPPASERMCAKANAIDRAIAVLEAAQEWRAARLRANQAATMEAFAEASEALGRLDTATAALDDDGEETR